MKIFKDRNEGIAAIIVSVPCLAIVGGGLYGATISGDWNDWTFFIIFGGAALVPCLLMLLDALGILGRIINK